MNSNLYDMTIPALVRGLTNLSALLDKGAAYAETKKFDAVVLVQARLFPDMHPPVFGNPSRGLLHLEIYCRT